MIKVRMLTTGKIVEVTNNEAHGLIESKQAEAIREGSPEQEAPKPYTHRQMKPVSKTSKHK